MIWLSVPLSLLLWIMVAKADLFDKKNLNELCYVCACSDDEANVDCSRRGLTDVPDGFNKKVVMLNVSTNEISVFPKNLARFPNLATLDLSGNRLNELPTNALYNLTFLEVLYLSNNNFDNWINMSPNDVFEPASNLKILDLSYNKLKIMGNLANQELIISASLETLILEHCQINSIHGRSPLSGLINIRVFKLNYNPLLRIQNLVSPTLKSLHLSNCELSTIYHNELSYLPSLAYLKLSHNYRLELSTSSYNLISNSLKYLDISFCNILRPSLQGFPNLRRAILNHNMIRYLGSNEFLNNSKLEQLDLSYNNIGSLKGDTFRGLTTLKQLDLSWNEIAEIPENSLLEMPNLTQIKLSRNYLAKVGHLKSTSVNVIDMSACEISNIDKNSLEGLPSLVDLNLSHNLLSHIPDSISSSTLRYFNLNYNRISSIGNYTFFMLPRLTALSFVGNRFTTVWKKSYFDSNPYLDKLDLGDNMWRCECADPNMFEFYEFVTLEPNKKEESYNLICNSPTSVIGQTWLEACYFTWNPTEKKANALNLMWFIVVMIVGLALTLMIVNTIRTSLKRRLAAIQAERERQVEEARDRLRQLRMRAEQEALCNAPDPRDLISPPSYDEALSMPKLNTSCHSLNETGRKGKKKRGRRKTKSSSDLLDETERNGDMPVVDDMELTEVPDSSRQRRHRPRRFGSHEIADLEQSPGARRRHVSEYIEADEDASEAVTVEVVAELERPLRSRIRRYSSEDNERRESDF